MLGVGWGVDGGWMPLPTRPQRYCDPVSLVSLLTYSLAYHALFNNLIGWKGFYFCLIHTVPLYLFTPLYMYNKCLFIQSLD